MYQTLGSANYFLNFDIFITICLQSADLESCVKMKYVCAFRSIFSDKIRLPRNKSAMNLKIAHKAVSEAYRFAGMFSDRE